MTIQPVAGGIRYRTAGTTTITVYLPSGSVAARATVAAGEGVVAVEASGILVVKAQSGSVNQSFKVAL